MPLCFFIQITVQSIIYFDARYNFPLCQWKCNIQGERMSDSLPQKGKRLQRSEAASKSCLQYIQVHYCTVAAWHAQSIRT